MMPEDKPAGSPGRNAARLFGSFTPLIVAWSAIGGAAVLAATVLQILGPPHPAAKLAQVGAPPAPASVVPEAVKPTATTATAPKAPPSPQAAAPLTTPAPAASTALGPAPPLSLSGKAIPEPLPGMLEAATEVPGQVLPRISADGHRPEQVYAAFFNPDERHPRIALVMDGMGLDHGLSEHAMQTLPAGIDFAYSAYAPAATAATLATEGRRRGRECLVSLPMEPSGYPLTDEGSKALLTGAEPEVNRQNMQSALAHVQGCVGATGASDGMSGERFAGMHQEFADVLSELSKRGLLYLDSRDIKAPADGLDQAPRSADLIVDRAADTSSPASPETIDIRLAALERRAAERGSAIGVVGPPTPMLIERLAVWSNSLAAHGLILAPLTAIRPPERSQPAEEAVH